MTVDMVDASGAVTDTRLFSENAACVHCGISYPELTPASFSSIPQGVPQMRWSGGNHGICAGAGGAGSRAVDPGRCRPPWENRNSVQFAEFLEALTDHYGVDIYTPFEELPESFQQVVLYGSGDEKIPFYIHSPPGGFYPALEGVIPNLERRYMDTPAQKRSSSS
ncbi:MAG: hypothetical protein R2874_08175 [Desulfobacterales bacterium]